MTPLKLVFNFLGTLLPIVFPKQEFKPKRLGAVVICFLLTIASIKLLGVDITVQGLDITEEFLQLSEE